MSTPHWPLLDLRVRTPRVELRPPDEQTMFALVDLADRGVHDPDFVPFLRAWTLEPDGERQRHSMQYYWRCWSGWTVDAWELPFSVWVDGTLVGMQGMVASSFRVTRTFETGSWLGVEHQGQGIGKEMRAAILHFAFVGLGALRADTGAIEGNDRSVGVTRALGYVDNGQTVKARDEERILCNEFRLERADWEARRRDDITIEGLAPCLPLFGLDSQPELSQLQNRSAHAAVPRKGVRVAGMDGCRGGWVLVTATVDPAASADDLRLHDVEVTVTPQFAEVVDRVRADELASLGVDMPIGLPERGQRAADQAARMRLGPRRSSVFPTPVRDALAATDYPDALARSRAVDGRGLSKQAFNLLPAMAEVDAAIAPELQDRVIECHPETVFARLNGGPVSTRKHDAAGIADRRRLLDPWLADGIANIGSAPSGAKVDDVLDAVAVALTAARLTIGDVEHLGDGERDARGLRMEIVV